MFSTELKVCVKHGFLDCTKTRRKREGMSWNRDGQHRVYHGFNRGGFEHSYSHRRNNVFVYRALTDKAFRFNGPADGARLLGDMSSFDDGADLVYQLTHPEQHGEALIKRLLSMDSSVEYFKCSIVPFLRRLGRDDMCVGTLKADLHKIINIIMEIPGFRVALRNAASALTTTKDVETISWFAYKVGILRADARVDPDIKAVVDELIERDAPLAATLNTIFGESMQTAETIATEPSDLSICDLTEMPGGRHDNDHRDFRSIGIAPTTEEIESERQPYLPFPGFSLIKDPVAALLDRQFRILREDLLGPMRSLLRDFAHSDTGNTSSRRVDKLPIFHRVQFEGIETQPRPCILVSCTLPAQHRAFRLKKADAVKYWKTAGTKQFPISSLVALVDTRVPKVLKFAMIVKADALELAHHDNGVPRPRLGLAFTGSSLTRALPHDVTELFKHIGRGPTNLSLARACASFFTYEPVLKCLQTMVDIPFSNELVHGGQPEEATYLSHVDIDAEIAEMERKDGFSYDPSQTHALRLGLTLRVALCVGPPGTGKTHIGVRLADVIYRQTKERILVLTYTNHALDDFLGELVNQNITQITRIGSKCSDKLKQYRIEDQAKASRQRERSKPTRGSASFYNRRRFATYKRRHRDIGVQLEEANKRLSGQHVGPKSWSVVQEHLRLKHPKLLHQLEVSPFDTDDDDGFEIVGPNGKPLEADYLWKRWLAGEDGGLLQTSIGEKSIWSLDSSIRLKLKAQWEEEMSSPRLLDTVHPSPPNKRHRYVYQHNSTSLCECAQVWTCPLRTCSRSSRVRQVGTTTERPAPR